MSEAYASFHDFYYDAHGYREGVNVPSNAPGMSMTSPGNGIVKKANNIFQMGSTDYVDPLYSAIIHQWELRYKNNFALLPKTDFSLLGDALKAYLSDPSTITDVVKGVAETDTSIFNTGDLPALAKVNGATSVGILQKIIQCHWTEGILFKQKQAGFQNAPQFTSADLKAYFAEIWMSEIDKMTLRDTDTVAGYNLTSIDNLISGYAEQGIVDTPSDVDFFGQDRHTASSNADAIMNVSATTRPLTLTIVDDLLVDQAAANPTQVYGMTHGALLNVFERLIQSKQNFIGQSRAMVTKEGVQTRLGENTGFQITTYSGGGINDIPIFTDNAVNQGPANGKGTLYFPDADDIEFRVSMPQTFWDTPNDAFAIMGANGGFQTRNLFATIGEVVCSVPRKHSKITAIN